MHLWLINHLEKNNLLVTAFFRAAYQWKWNKDYDPWNDYAQYTLNGLIPRHVVGYIKHIQSGGNYVHDQS